MHRSPRRLASAAAAAGVLATVGAAHAPSGVVVGRTAAQPGSVADQPPTGCAYRPRSTNVRAGPGSRRRIALTFDDGPSPYTARILDVLEREGVPATFFVEGRNVAGHEELLARMLAEGDMIGNHSFTHVDLWKANATALAEIDDTQAAIVDATGFTPCVLRPPHGRTSKQLLAALARRKLTSMLWSVNPQDFRRPGVAKIRQRVLAGVKPGAIVLMHDGGGDRSQTVAAVPSIVRTLKSRGYGFVTVTDLLGLRVKRGVS